MTVKKREFTRGVRLRPDDVALEGNEGEIKVGESSQKIETHIEGQDREIVTDSQTQTLTNKTVDADNNTISNLETDNLKAGVLRTDLSAPATDTEIPSALAVQNALDGQNEASEITYDPTGNPETTATNVQDALDDTGTASQAAQDAADAAQSTVDTHIANPTGAHAATAVSYDNSTSGLTATQTQAAIDEVEARVDSIEGDYVQSFNSRNGAVVPAASDYDADQIDYDNSTSGLSATDAQGAIDEVEGRVDTAETNIGNNATAISDHIADPTDAHAASAITNTPSGNLTATDVQGALNELQTDVDTRATSADLTAHTSASAGVHGVTGDVVGTSDTQTLTNKTVQGADFQTPTRSDVKQDTLANLTVYASTATNGQLAFATDTKQLFQVIDNELTPVGEGVGSLDVFHTERFEQTDAADASTGNNATFLGGGSIVGTLADETASPIKGDRSLKYTQAVGSLNDYAALPAFAVEEKEQNNLASASVYTTYDGNDGDVDFVVYDATNASVVARLPLRASTTALKQELIFTVPDTATSLQYGIQTMTENNGAEIVFDEVEFLLNPLTPTNIKGEQTIVYDGYTSRDGNNFYLFANEATNEGDNGIIEVFTNGGTYTGYLFKKDAHFTVSFNYSGNNNQELRLARYDNTSLGSILQESREGANGVVGTASVTMSGYAQEGNLIIARSGGTANNQIETNFTITASAINQGVVVNGVVEKNQSYLFAQNNGSTAITANVTPIDFTTINEDTSNSWSGDTFTAPFKGNFTLMGTIATTVSVNYVPRIWKSTNGGASFSSTGIDLLFNNISNDFTVIGGVINLEEGDQIQVRSGTSINLSPDNFHQLSITGEQDLANVTVTVPSDFFPNNATISTVSGSFTGGEIKVSRLGNQVTVSATSDLTHASLSDVSSAVGLIPEWARPSAIKSNMYNIESSALRRVSVDTDGTLRTTYFDNTYSLTAVTSSTVQLTITYYVD